MADGCRGLRCVWFGVYSRLLSHPMRWYPPPAPPTLHGAVCPEAGLLAHLRFASSLLCRVPCVACRAVCRVMCALALHRRQWKVPEGPPGEAAQELDPQAGEATGRAPGGRPQARHRCASPFPFFFLFCFLVCGGACESTPLTATCDHQTTSSGTRASTTRAPSWRCSWRSGGRPCAPPPPASCPRATLPPPPPSSHLVCEPPHVQTRCRHLYRVVCRVLCVSRQLSS